jgi:hypothetical protein
MTEVIATLIAALVAAVATVVSAIIAVGTQRKVQELQPRLDAIQHDFEAKLALAGFRRERLSIALNDLGSAQIELAQLSQIVGRMLWLTGEPHAVQTRVYDAELKVQECAARIYSSLSTIRGFGVVNESVMTQCAELLDHLRRHWEKLMGQAYLKVTSIAEHYPNQSFDSAEFVKLWGEFENICAKLTELIDSLPARIERHERAL